MNTQPQKETNATRIIKDGVPIEYWMGWNGVTWARVRIPECKYEDFFTAPTFIRVKDGDDWKIFRKRSYTFDFVIYVSDLGDVTVARTVIPDVQEAVSEWTRETFPDTHNDGLITHMHIELEELKAAETAEDRADEIADIFILAIDYCAINNIDMYQAIMDKLEKCKKRQWHPQDDRGVYRHVGEDEGR